MDYEEAGAAAGGCDDVGTAVAVAGVSVMGTEACTEVSAGLLLAILGSGIYKHSPAFRCWAMK